MDATINNFITPSNINKFDSLAVDVKNNGNNSSYLLLSGQYTPMCHGIIEKYKPSLQQSGLLFNDFSEKIPDLIFDACRTYNPNKASFSTHLYNTINYDCLNSINNNTVRTNIRSDIKYVTNEYIRNDNPDASSFAVMDDYEVIINELKGLKDKRVWRVFKHRFFGKKTLSFKQIGKKMKISSQTAFLLYKSGLNIVRNKIMFKD